MKTTFAVLALTSVAAATTGRERVEELFYEHMTKYDLDISDGKEFLKRMDIFSDNLRIIENHNADEKKTFTMGLNKFSHLTHEEWKSMMNFGAVPPKLRQNAKVHGEPSTMEGVPDSVDWTAAGAVTPVKNQGQCGSCWSFSTTGSLEGAYYIKNSNLVSFSEQELVSCDHSDNGCNGGWMDAAFTWINGNGGLPTEADYPYVSGSGSVPPCNTSKKMVSGSAPSSFTDVQPGSVSALMSAVAQQPVSVAIQADQSAFQHYSSGVLTSGCGQQLDHGVLATGYGTSDDGIDYWMVKNSWGPEWGDNGYILIERSSANLCGILSAASYPVM
jgi:C1A family cysteine protease